jgi:hypothetical protein
MKKLALFAAVIAVMAAGASATTAGASNGNQTPGCQTSTWDVTITFSAGPVQIPVSPLVRCAPTVDGGPFTLSGTAEGFCPATISGTINGNDVNMTWTTQAPCQSEVFTLTGTLKFGKGSGSGDFTSTLEGNGTWTATKTS